MRTAVIGHVEWVHFMRIDRGLVPGVIARSDASWHEAAGGGGVAAVELARLAGECTLYTALGADDVGRQIPDQLEAHGVRVLAGHREQPHRRVVTLLDPSGERSIVVVGEAQSPRADDGLSFEAFDVVYVCKGDVGMVRRARRANVLVATARMLPVLHQAGVPIDALVRSGSDPSEQYVRGQLVPEPALVATTEGDAGGMYRTAEGRQGRWSPADLPGPVVDAYGAGDCFAAALGFALAGGRRIDSALSYAADRGAAAVCRRGAHGGSQET